MQDYTYSDVHKTLPQAPGNDGSGYSQDQYQNQNQNQGELDAFDYINESRYASTVSTPLPGATQYQTQQNHGQGAGYVAGLDGHEAAGVTGHDSGYGDDGSDQWNRSAYAGRSGDNQQYQAHQQQQQQQQSRQATSGYNSSDPAAALFVPFAQQRANRGTSSVQGYSPEPPSARSSGNPMQDAQRDVGRNAHYPHSASDVAQSHFSGSTSPNPIFSQSGQGGMRPSSLSHYQQGSYDEQHAAATHVHPINAGFGMPLAPEALQAAYSAPYPQHGSHSQMQNRMPQTEAPNERTGPVKKQKKFEIDGNDAEANRPVVPPPVKNACLSCRTKKARCDGVQPICTQCSSKGRECVYVKSRRGGARRRKDKSLNVPPPPPSALKEFLARLDGLQAPGGEPPELDGLSMTSGAEGGATGPVDPAIAVRSYAPDDVDGM